MIELTVHRPSRNEIPMPRTEYPTVRLDPVSPPTSSFPALVQDEDAFADVLAATTPARSPRITKAGVTRALWASTATMLVVALGMLAYPTLASASASWTHSAGSVATPTVNPTLTPPAYRAPQQKKQASAPKVAATGGSKVATALVSKSVAPVRKSHKAVETAPTQRAQAAADPDPTSTDEPTTPATVAPTLNVDDGATIKPSPLPTLTGPPPTTMPPAE